MVDFSAMDWLLQLDLLVFEDHYIHDIIEPTGWEKLYHEQCYFFARLGSMLSFRDVSWGGGLGPRWVTKRRKKKEKKRKRKGKWKQKEREKEEKKGKR